MNLAEAWSRAFATGPFRQGLLEHVGWSSQLGDLNRLNRHARTALGLDWTSPPAPCDWVLMQLDATGATLGKHISTLHDFGCVGPVAQPLMAFREPAERVCYPATPLHPVFLAISDLAYGAHQEMCHTEAHPVNPDWREIRLSAGYIVHPPQQFTHDTIRVLPPLPDELTILGVGGLSFTILPPDTPYLGRKVWIDIFLDLGDGYVESLSAMHTENDPGHPLLEIFDQHSHWPRMEPILRRFFDMPNPCEMLLHATIGLDADIDPVDIAEINAEPGRFYFQLLGLPGTRGAIGTHVRLRTAHTFPTPP